MTIRLCKTALVGAVAVFFALVAFGNVTDYGTNLAFVRHVLAMDTIFPGSTVMWRAITEPALVTTAYVTIIAWEAATGVVLFLAAARMAGACGAPGRFAAVRPQAVLGLTMGLLLYGLGFIVIGGEWFAMWQSPAWNGVPSAIRFVELIGLTLLVVLAPDG